MVLWTEQMVECASDLAGVPPDDPGLARFEAGQGQPAGQPFMHPANRGGAKTADRKIVNNRFEGGGVRYAQSHWNGQSRARGAAVFLRGEAVAIGGNQGHKARLSRWRDATS